jgi:hypothetical protein
VTAQPEDCFGRPTRRPSPSKSRFVVLVVTFQHVNPLSKRS